ncbi:MAG: hypothetical protein ACKN9W_11445 [Methylococcus sp.]
MNAVAKTVARLESIYDHGITDAELDEMFFGQPEPMDEYFQGFDQEDLLVDIVQLYRMRNDQQKVNHYISLISDAAIRAEMLTRGCCEARS